MILAAVVQFVVCFLILRWLLKKKTGEPYSGKTIARFILFGAIGVVLWFLLSLALPLDADTFFGMNPYLSGFLTAFITAALIEAVVVIIGSLIALILFLRKIAVWSRKGEKQELLNAEG
ncbi:MAG: hypothetical protein IJT16_03155 [Lachnospiraceae bacterium]|nr:hypothetical protein [Lachnospiraceae bacterium]